MGNRNQIWRRTQIEEAVKEESARISSIMRGDGMEFAKFHSKLNLQSLPDRLMTHH
ncbi:MAG: hypothetical protein Ct9H90mP1_0510 [Methanobacteriota archaeon]|nr:MAG: hypothetical protein Ct9H90mP1_0510 [Euryarchaeota archaeon]